MKKLFTLLFTIGSFTTVFAQYNNDYKNDRGDRDANNKGGYSKPAERPEVYDRNNDKRDYAYNNRRYNESFAMTSREREFRIQKINREYDFKISSVSRNRYLRPWEKNSEIRSLERQRHDEIRNIEARFNDKRNRYNDGRSNRW